jgi:hypothetical protein
VRWFLGSLAALGWVVLGVACNTVDPSECWPNTSGGFGGGGTIPIGSEGASSGDFPSPPPGPLDYGSAANPCIATQSPCKAMCQSNYEAASAECAKIQDDGQRKACQDGAFATYDSCRNDCARNGSSACDDKYTDCVDNGPSSCGKKSGGKTLCQRCWERCNAGDAPSSDCKKCRF